LKVNTYNNIQLLGMMSGTSLDGLDIAHVIFDFSNQKSVEFQLLNHQTYPLPKQLFEPLSEVLNISASQVFELDQQIALFYAQCVNDFLTRFRIERHEITALASHGQTIFHRPERGYTTQIGCGTTLNYLTKIPVIDQFRQLDVSAGGQGAPLVPLGDAHLFGPLADGFLNLGGFANISTLKNGKSLAFDIAPANLPMNKWVQEIGLNYDENGKLASTGRVDKNTMNKVMALDFFAQFGPKSLGTEWLETHYLPHFATLSMADRLRTHLEIVKNLSLSVFEKLDLKKVYVTGGGAHNQFLIQLLKDTFRGELYVPDATIIDYKEALIFAYLGARHLRNETTTLCEVTGAQHALRTGILHDFEGRIR
jgi:anhydro-N-acetylmuramic acid kinase